VTGNELIRLAASYAAGDVSADWIANQYGASVFSSVFAIASGGIAGVAVNKALDVVDYHTGIVSDVGSVVDDVIDTFKFW
jgi:hypothetical protein